CIERLPDDHDITAADIEAMGSGTVGDVEPGEDTWMDVLGQCPTISLPVRFNGEGRDTIAIRPIHTTRFMTGNFGRLPTEMVDRIADAAVENGFSGLLYDVTHKPPGTIEYE
ncbi:MAG: hypothetical protein ABEK12_02020, partial [Candidatus Nanohaloarchaea archaeon]